MNSELYILLSGMLVAAASGLVGSFLVLRKMTLMSDALSHVALPGIALGIMFHFEPLIGGLFFLLVSVFIIWGIEHKTKLAAESITGVLFVTALAIGALLIPEHELLETFFGSIEQLTVTQIILQSTLAVVIFGITLKFLKPLLLSSIAPDLAQASNIPRHKMELLLLALITLTITIGINFVGILLMSALVIVPAAAARNFSKNLKTFLATSVALAVISLLVGLVISAAYQIPSGVATVLASACLFILSLPKTKTHTV